MSEDGKLNGFRAPLIVNAVTLIPIAAVLISTWSDVQQLKADRADRVTPERLAKIEALLSVGTDSRYRAGDATRDFALRDAEIQRIREDLRVLADRIERNRKQIDESK